VIASNTLPDNSGYVAAAYLVFLALILVYVTIMAVRLSRTERELVELNRDAERGP
jgi:isoprenylcysteine carboxyl methyltransferase (ICMT) family protein YpbQ